VRLSVLHRTCFTYGAPVRDSVNTLHLQPRSGPWQRVVSTLIRVLPPTRLRAFCDLFGNPTHHFELPEPHTRLEIESRIVVDVYPRDLTDEQRSTDRAVMDDPGIRNQVWPFLQDSPRVYKTPEIWRQAVDLTVGRLSVFRQAEAIMRWIHEHFAYRPGVTDVKSDLMHAFRERSGVCQDFAHIMIGMCRSIGLPARYVSGYLYNGPRDHLVGSQASHAWCEVYVPGADWVGFDPTNDTLVDDRFVKVAVGRDYGDVPPVAGYYLGPPTQSMEVEVAVHRV